MASDVKPRAEVHHVGREHQLIVCCRLDQDDVDAWVAILPLLCHLVKTLVGEQLERLVADMREAHFRHPRLAPTLLIRRLKIVHIRNERVDDNDELGARLNGDVQVGR